MTPYYSVFFVHAMKVTSDQNSLVTNSIQNTLFDVVQKKVSHSGLKQHEIK